MRGIQRFLRCIKNGIIVILGGDPPQKSGIIGMLVLFLYFLLIGLIVVGSRNAHLPSEDAIRLMLIGSGLYFLLLAGIAVIYEWIRNLFQKE